MASRVSSSRTHRSDSSGDSQSSSSTASTTATAGPSFGPSVAHAALSYGEGPTSAEPESTWLEGMELEGGDFEGFGTGAALLQDLSQGIDPDDPRVGQVWDAIQSVQLSQTPTGDPGRDAFSSLTAVAEQLAGSGLLPEGGEGMLSTSELEALLGQLDLDLDLLESGGELEGELAEGEVAEGELAEGEEEGEGEGEEEAEGEGEGEEEGEEQAEGEGEGLALGEEGGEGGGDGAAAIEDAKAVCEAGEGMADAGGDIGAVQLQGREGTGRGDADGGSADGSHEGPVAGNVSIGSERVNPSTPTAPSGGGGGGGGGTGGGGRGPDLSGAQAMATPSFTMPSGGAGSAPAAAIPAASPEVAAGEEEEDAEQQVSCESSFTYDHPAGLADPGSPELNLPSLDTAPGSETIAESVLPTETAFERPGDAPSAPGMGASGTGLVESGVDAAAASGPISVTPDAGSTAGAASASGGSASAQDFGSNLNPASGQAMATTAVPGRPTLDMGERGGGEGGGGEQAAAGGSSSLPDVQVQSVTYNGDGEESMAPVAGPELPNLDATITPAAQSQIDAEAATLEPVGPEMEGLTESQVVPALEQGNTAVQGEMDAWAGQQPGFESTQQGASADAATGIAAAAAEAAAAVALATSTSGERQSTFASSEVPAELTSASGTVADVVAQTAAAAAQAVAGQPAIELPADATAHMQDSQAAIDGFAGELVAPDIQGDFAGVSLPDPGLEVLPIEDVCSAEAFEFDESRIPAIPQTQAPRTGGPGEFSQVEAEVLAQLEPAVFDHQAQVVSELGQHGAEGFQEAYGEVESLHGESTGMAESALAEWDAIDIEAEVAASQTTADQAMDTALGEVDGANAEMATAFDAGQMTFEGDAQLCTDTFATDLETADGDHTSAVDDAQSTYSSDIDAANTQLRGEHDAALGEYAGSAQGAVQGAQQTYSAEQQLCAAGVAQHEGQFASEYATLSAEAEGVGAEAEARFQAEHAAQLAHVESQREALLSEADASVQAEVDRGNAQICEINTGAQSEAEAEMSAAVDSANQQVDQANSEANARLDEAHEEPSLLERATNWLKDQINSALSWIRDRFNDVKNAINSALEAAKNRVVGILNAAREAALSALDAVRNTIQSVISSVASRIRGVIEAVSSHLQAVVGAVTSFINTAIQGITTAINGALEAFQQSVNMVVDGFVSVVSMVDADLGARLDQAADAFQTRFDAAVDGAQGNIDAASQQMQATVDAAGQNLQANIEAAENVLQEGVTRAEETLHTAVDAAHDIAADRVNQAFDIAEQAVVVAFDTAQAAVTAVIDTAYAAVETAVRAYETVIVAGMEALDSATEWVQSNILEPLGEFAAQAWLDLQQGFVAFWNSPWRDIIIGGAITALAVGLTVATGGLAAPLTAGLIIAGSGMLAAGVYTAGEIGAREANQNLILNHGIQTWEGESTVDPVTGEVVPDFRDPRNAWYLDTLGDFSSNPDGSVTYTDASGEQRTMSPEELANLPPEEAARIQGEIMTRDEDGNLIGEDFGDTVNSGIALGAQKGLEQTVNSTIAVLAAPASGASVTASVGQQTLRTQLQTQAINSIVGQGTGLLGNTTREMIEDDKGFAEAFGDTWAYDSWEEAVVGIGTQTAFDTFGGVLGDRIGGIETSNWYSTAGREVLEHGSAGILNQTNATFQQGLQDDNNGILDAFGHVGDQFGTTEFWQGAGTQAAGSAYSGWLKDYAEARGEQAYVNGLPEGTQLELPLQLTPVEGVEGVDELPDVGPSSVREEEPTAYTDAPEQLSLFEFDESGAVIEPEMRAAPAESEQTFDFDWDAIAFDDSPPAQDVAPELDLGDFDSVFMNDGPQADVDVDDTMEFDWGSLGNDQGFGPDSDDGLAMADQRVVDVDGDGVMDGYADDAEILATMVIADQQGNTVDDSVTSRDMPATDGQVSDQQRLVELGIPASQLDNLAPETVMSLGQVEQMIAGGDYAGAQQALADIDGLGDRQGLLIMARLTEVHLGADALSGDMANLARTAELLGGGFTASPEDFQGFRNLAETDADLVAHFQQELGGSTVDEWHAAILQRIGTDHPVASSMSAEELVAVYGYTTNAFDRLNGALRSLDADQIETLLPFLRVATSGLNNAPNVDGSVLTRRAHGVPDFVDAALQPGNIYTDRAFGSSSLRDDLTNFGTAYIFTIETSESGTAVMDFSAFRHEQEVLFQPGTRFHVVDRTDNPDGTVHITLRQAEQ